MAERLSFQSNFMSGLKAALTWIIATSCPTMHWHREVDDRPG